MSALAMAIANHSHYLGSARMEQGRRDVPLRLSDLAIGDCGVIRGIEPVGGSAPHDMSADELERRLLEMGFVEGAQFRILHEGLIGRDPIAVKLDDMRVALRRSEARTILVEHQRETAAGKPAS